MGSRRPGGRWIRPPPQPCLVSCNTCTPLQSGFNFARKRCDRLFYRTPSGRGSHRHFLLAASSPACLALAKLFAHEKFDVAVFGTCPVEALPPPPPPAPPPAEVPPSPPTSPPSFLSSRRFASTLAAACMAANLEELAPHRFLGTAASAISSVHQRVPAVIAAGTAW